MTLCTSEAALILRGSATPHRELWRRGFRPFEQGRTTAPRSHLLRGETRGRAASEKTSSVGNVGNRVSQLYEYTRATCGKRLREHRLHRNGFRSQNQARHGSHDAAAKECGHSVRPVQNPRRTSKEHVTCETSEGCSEHPTSSTAHEVLPAAKTVCRCRTTTHQPTSVGICETDVARGRTSNPQR